MAEEKKKPGRPPGSKNKSGGTAKSGGKSGSGKDSGGKTGKNPGKTEKPVKVGSRVRDEIWAIIIIAIGAFLVVAIQTSAAGAFGEILHKFFLGSFGMLAYVLPYYLILYGILLFLDKAAHISGKSAFFLLTIFLMLTLLNSVRFIDLAAFEMKPKYLIGLFDDGVLLKNGGLFGMLVGSLIAKALGKVGLVILSLVVIIVLLLLVLNTPVSQFFERLKAKRAEKQAARIAAYEEAERLAQEESERLAQEEKKEAAARPEKPAVLVRAENQTVSSGTKTNAAAAGSAKEKPAADVETSYVPGRMSEGQIRIMNYMKDNALFERAEDLPESEVRYGLEEAPLRKPGYGLDPPEEAVGLPEETTGLPEEQTGFSAEQTADAHVQTARTAETERQIGAAGAPAVAVALEPPARVSETHFVTAETAGKSASATQAQPVSPAYDTEKKLTKKEAESAMLSAEELNLPSAAVKKEYRFPPLDLLSAGKRTDQTGADYRLRLKAEKLEDTLKNFHVDARVIQVTQGPAVTRYEIQPAVGVKVSSIVRLADDIALNLEAKSIRMEAPIPGKAAVGIEVENDHINMVTLREIIGSKEFQEAKSKISFAVGRDIPGNAIVGNLKSMPHLLIAGSTGSGKSVCINSVILSILYKATPEEVKLVLIDPKVVELGNYNGIPHLLIPVVTEPSKAAAALNWAVAEMNERYKKFEEEGVRELEAYNSAARRAGEPERVMPQIVIIIDELADLMMTASSQVEESICRLAQKARAAGMHLIVATQRPSVDVVTGLIKANIPSRIAFAVSSQVDSRTILDMGGAEKLVGKGDMLYKPQGLGKPIRVQGTFASDEEVNSVIEFIKAQSDEVEYAGEVISTIENANGEAPAQQQDDGDELLPDAIELVVHNGQASVSMLQRRFRIGYNRAARIIDMMEARGIVGPPDGSRPRQVLLSETELYAMQHGGADDAEAVEDEEI